MADILIRAATPADAALLAQLVDGLADYEKLPRPSADARERLRNDAFGDRPRIRVYIASINDRAVGYALTFDAYSSFLALPTLYLEDLFVLPEYRRHGVGRAFFRFLAAEALRGGYGRMDWAVLDWNQPAIDFYQKLGARHIRDWQLYRLTHEQLQEVARA